MNEKRDPNLDHEAVKLYRDVFKFCPNRGTRGDITATVTDVGLWKSVLSEWKEQKWNPLKVNWMLSDYERREKSTERSVNANGRSRERTSEKKVGPLRVSEWRNSHLSCVPENAGVRFRASSKTLEEVVTEALRQNNRS